MHKFLLLFALILVTEQVKSQDAAVTYQKAKILFESGNFELAANEFNTLVSHAELGAYASFFYGLSIYRSDKTDAARAVWKQLMMDFPNWTQTTELLYWLSLSAFEQGNFDEGLTYLDSYTRKFNNADAERDLVGRFLSKSNVVELTVLQKYHPENRTLASLLLSKILQQPFAGRDTKLIKQIIESYQLDMFANAAEGLETIYRDRYSVALVLPFMFEGYHNNSSVMRNSLVMELYQGMLIAQKELAKENINLDFYLYDTQKSEEVTRTILPKLAAADLIIGPFYPEPIRLVNEYSNDNRINMVNPLSNNADYIGQNPFSFLLKPAYETMAISLASHAASKHNNRNTMVLYSKDPRDSIFAMTYRNEAYGLDMEIVDFRSLDELSAKSMLDTLIKTYEHIYTKQEADSLGQLPGRFIKTRKIRESELNAKQPLPWFYEELDETQQLRKVEPSRLVAYEMKLKIPKDSIGHIMVATRSNTIANNLISAVATRGDSTGLYGYGDWFDFGVVNYKLQESIGLNVANPDYYRRGNDFAVFQSKVATEFKTIVTPYHVSGFESMMYLGRMLNKYGKYFQTGFTTEGYTQGILSEGFDFRSGNDNQVVPIITLKNLEKTPVNTLNYEYR